MTTLLEKEIDAFDESVNRLTNDQSDFHTGECYGILHDKECPTIKMRRHFSVFLRQSLPHFAKSVIEEAENLPLGKELWIGDRYKIILHCAEKLKKLWFWQRKKRIFYQTVLKRVI